jgi:hypothetical protein
LQVNPIAKENADYKAETDIAKATVKVCSITLRATYKG